MNAALCTRYANNDQASRGSRWISRHRTQASVGKRCWQPISLYNLISCVSVSPTVQRVFKVQTYTEKEAHKLHTMNWNSKFSSLLFWREDRVSNIMLLGKSLALWMPRVVGCEKTQYWHFLSWEVSSNKGTKTKARYSCSQEVRSRSHRVPVLAIKIR